MISISERLRARQEPVGDGSGKWRKDGLCQEAAEIMDEVVEAVERVLVWVQPIAGDNIDMESAAKEEASIAQLNAALAKAKGKHE